MEYSAVINSVDGEGYLLTLRHKYALISELYGKGKYLGKLSPKY